MQKEILEYATEKIQIMQKYYSERSKRLFGRMEGIVIAKGEVAFSRLPVNGNVAGHMYTITESFCDGYEIQKRRRFFLSSTNESLLDIC